MNITFTYENDEGEELEGTLPGKNEVCSDCGGTGFTLREGMQGHAYTQSEFDESFDEDEDRAEYFRHGGKYDVQCSACHGNNVVPVVDEEACKSDEQKKVLELYNEKQYQDHVYARTCAAERRMGY